LGGYRKERFQGNGNFLGGSKREAMNVGFRWDGAVGW